MKLLRFTVSEVVVLIAPWNEIVKVCVEFAVANPTAAAKLRELPQLCASQDWALALIPKLIRPTTAVSADTVDRESTVAPAQVMALVNGVLDPVCEY